MKNFVSVLILGVYLIFVINIHSTKIPKFFDKGFNQIFFSIFRAGKVFSHRILEKCWDSILDVCSVLLNEKTAGGISNSLGLLLGMEGAKEESIRAREAVCTSLDGLQKAARLCCLLGKLPRTDVNETC